MKELPKYRTDVVDALVDSMTDVLNASKFDDVTVFETLIVLTKITDDFIDANGLNVADVAPLMFEILERTENLRDTRSAMRSMAREESSPAHENRAAEEKPDDPA